MSQADARTFGYQLAWYQREGVRVYAVERDLFLADYEEPIYEEGIQLKDMLRLAVEHQTSSEARAGSQGQ